MGKTLLQCRSCLFCLSWVVLGLDMWFLFGIWTFFLYVVVFAMVGGGINGRAKAKATATAKTTAIDQSLRPSDFAPASGRAVAALRLALDAGLKPRSTSGAKATAG
ncbi:MAG TPA: hypothetical protein VIX42_08730 [Edaphobacter sp.]